MPTWSEPKTHGTHTFSDCEGGEVIQFSDNKPSTYGYAFGDRLGVFESWDKAKAAVEKVIAQRQADEKAAAEREAKAAEKKGT